MKIDTLGTLIEPFCMSSLSTFQSKGNSQKLFHLSNIQKMSPPVHTLIDVFQNIVLKKVELEYQDCSTLIDLSPQLVNQVSKCDVHDDSFNFQE